MPENPSLCSGLGQALAMPGDMYHAVSLGVALEMPGDMLHAVSLGQADMLHAVSLGQALEQEAPQHLEMPSLDWQCDTCPAHPDELPSGTRQFQLGMTELSASLSQHSDGIHSDGTPRQPDANASLAELDALTGPDTWGLYLCDIRQGLADTYQNSSCKRRLFGAPYILAAFFKIFKLTDSDDWDASIQRVSEADESILNARLETLYASPLPFTIGHQELKLPDNICCVPMHRQLSLRLSDAILCGESRWGHIVDYNYLPDTISDLNCETSGKVMTRCVETAEHFRSTYVPGRYKFGITGSPVQRFFNGYVDTEEDYERFVLLHSSYERGIIEILEAALISIYTLDPHCLNFAKGGDGRMPGWGPYWVYMVVSMCGPSVRRSAMYHARR
jgi:hypothetical protein